MSLTRTNGWAVAAEQVGRDVKFVKVNATGIETAYAAADSDFEQVVFALQKHCTITIVGTPASSNAVFMVEGLPSGNIVDVTGTSAAVATALATDIDAASGLTSTVTSYNGLSGATFA